MNVTEVVLGVLALAIAAASAGLSWLAMRRATRADNRVAVFTGPMFEPTLYEAGPTGVVLEVTNIGMTTARDVRVRLANGEQVPDTVIAMAVAGAWGAGTDIVKVGSEARFFLATAGFELSDPRTSRGLLGSMGITHALVDWTDPDGTRRAATVRLPMLGESLTS